MGTGVGGASAGVCPGGLWVCRVKGGGRGFVLEVGGAWQRGRGYTLG